MRHTRRDRLYLWATDGNGLGILLVKAYALVALAIIVAALLQAL